MIIDGFRDSVWGLVHLRRQQVATVEGDVHHASAERFRGLMAQGGLRTQLQRQRVYHGRPAPFSPVTEAVAAEPLHHEFRPHIFGSNRASTLLRSSTAVLCSCMLSTSTLPR